MLKTRDEIIKKFGEIINIAAKEEDLPMIPEEEVELIGQDVKPKYQDIYETDQGSEKLLEKKIQRSQKTVNDNSKYYPLKTLYDYSQSGAPADAIEVATKYPKTYLLATQKPYPKGYVAQRQYDNLTDMVMANLIGTEPENYFHWKLNRRFELREKWFNPACVALMEKNPEELLMVPGLLSANNFIGAGLLPVLWVQLFRAGTIYNDNKTVKTSNSYVARKVKELIGLIAKHEPEFFDKYVEPLVWPTKK